MKKSNQAYIFPGMLLVTLLIFTSSLVWGKGCNIKGEYIYTENGKIFGAEAREANFVEIGKILIVDNTISGQSQATFYFPPNFLPDLPSLRAHVSLTYGEGNITLDKSECIGQGSWTCTATVLSSFPPSPPIPEHLVNSLLCGDVSSEKTINFIFFAYENGKKGDFIITDITGPAGTPPINIISSGTATFIRPVSSALKNKY